MCDPLTIGSALLTVGGTAMQQKAQRSAQKGIEGAIRANGEANDRLRNESRTGIMNSAQDFSREKFDQTQMDETAKVRQQLEAALSPGKLPGEYYGGQQSENTRKYTETKTKQTNDFSMQMADALAKLRGFGQGQQVNTRGVQRAGEVVGMNQNKESGNNAILPLQIEAAKRKGQTPLGDLFVGLGTAGTAAGLAGGGSSIFGSQGGLSRLMGTGSTGAVGPMQSFGNMGFNLV